MDPSRAGSDAVAAFLVEHLNGEVAAVQRVRAFATNAVYKVEAGARRFVVKASPLHDALRGEVWACEQGSRAECPAPAVLGFGRLGGGTGMSAFIMSLVEGSSLAGPHSVLREVGVRLRRLHEIRLPGFGSLSDASWDDTGGFSLRRRSWRALLDDVVGDPVWDLARFAHRADVASLSLLLEGYDPDGVLADDLAWRIPLYGALWQLIDAIVDHRLGGQIAPSLRAAIESMTSAR